MQTLDGGRCGNSSTEVLGKQQLNGGVASGKTGDGLVTTVFGLCRLAVWRKGEEDSLRAVRTAGKQGTTHPPVTQV